MSTTSFAQAQQRLAARRRAREQEAQARLVASRQASRVWSEVARLPFPFNRVGAASLSAWDAISTREGTRPAFRVGQVDAELLDEDLVTQLRDQVGEALKYFGANIKDDWSAEILLALRLVLFKLSVWDHDATYGAALQNLRYTDARRDGPVLVPPSKWQKSLYGLITVGGKYGWTKWENWLLDQDNGYDQPSPTVHRLSKFTSQLTTLHSVAAFASFLAFLLHGRYRTILDRVLKMRLAPPTSQVSREVSFEYLNRQLVWHAFTEFLLFVLPLVGINRWRRWLSRTWKKTKEIIHVGAEGDGAGKQGDYAFLPERTCAICYQDQNSAMSETEVLAAATSSGVIGSAQTDITNPYETIPCGCIYCFVCLATRLEREEGEGWTCLRCGELVKECKPWSGDVLEEQSKSPSATTKHVGFVDETPVANRPGQGEDADRQLKNAEVRYRQPSTAASDTPDDEDSEIYEEEEAGVGEDFNE
ncbi:Pex12 amino terminal region-domain-containing protein [Durotheca rogersii]|uniref:Pex12 amino terminal region-domain-containing protein n=1 Tax=Durotheca rogersii TaxID=419775 RepID=UPI00221EFF9A|nr:Pex12 amino terminal region-domain-containing protein [Durotheca rogersii]KAI5864739.1 Pex12 amino terminal region-domain-containing protein [Durotheca rogersii]